MTGDRNLFGEELPKLGAPPFAENWGNGKAFWIGVHTGHGLTAQRICKRINDGVTPNMITGMWTYWGYAPDAGGFKYAAVPVPLTGIHRTMIDAEAERRNMDIQDICQAVIETVAKENLWKALLDA